MSEPIDCPRLRDVWALRDGELDGARAAEVEAHLAGCPACRTEQEEWDRVSRFLSVGDPAAPTSPERRRALKKELLDACARSLAADAAAAVPPRRRWWTLPRFGLALTAVAAAILLIVLARVVPPRPHPHQEVRTTPPRERRQPRPDRMVNVGPIAPGPHVAPPTPRKHPDGARTDLRHRPALPRQARSPSAAPQRGKSAGRVTRSRQILVNRPETRALPAALRSHSLRPRQPLRPEPTPAPSRLVIDAGRSGAPTAAPRSITIVAWGDAAANARGFTPTESHSEEAGP